MRIRKNQSLSYQSQTEVQRSSKIDTGESNGGGGAGDGGQEA